MRSVALRVPLLFHCYIQPEVSAQVIDQSIAHSAIFVRKGQLVTGAIGLHDNDETVAPFGVAHCVHNLPQPVFVPLQLTAAAKCDAQSAARG